VSGIRKSCERAYLEKLPGNGKMSRADGVLAQEHHLSDLKT
jgi:hypothetical protein